MKINTVMTPCPYTIDSVSSIDHALEIMGTRGIRHLPVVENGELLGVLSERDIVVANLVCETSGYCPLVSDICKKDPVVVEAEATVGSVAEEMANEKADVALVADNEGNFVGIFTETDAYRVLAMIYSESNSQE